MNESELCGQSHWVIVLPDQNAFLLAVAYVDCDG